MPGRLSKTVTIQIQIEIPESVKTEEVVTQIDALLNEPPCDWGEWSVGFSEVVKTSDVFTSETFDEDDDDYEDDELDDGSDDDEEDELDDQDDFEEDDYVEQGRFNDIP